MTMDQGVLILSAYRYSDEMGQAVEAVMKPRGHPALPQAKKLYKLLKHDGGKHLSPELFMALLDAVRTRLREASPRTCSGSC